MSKISDRQDAMSALALHVTTQLTNDAVEPRWEQEGESKLKILLEFVVLLLRIWFECFKSIFRLFVKPAARDLTGDIVLITGAGHGIGREMALRFSKLDAVVVCVDINPKGNEETYKMLKNLNKKVYKYECDVTNRSAMIELAAKVTKEVGDVTILVNNAGIMPCKPVLKQTEQEIRLMMDINVNGVLWGIQAFLPTMLKNNRGHIVSMSSMAGIIGLNNLVPYCASKFAVRGIMQALGVELREYQNPTDGIKLTTVCPFIVETGLCKKPKLRFPYIQPTVQAGDAADQIVDAVRRGYYEISIPPVLWFSHKWFLNIMPVRVYYLISDFTQTGVNAHDD